MPVKGHCPRGAAWSRVEQPALHELQKEPEHAGAREQVRPLSFGAALDGPWEVVLMGSYQRRDPYADHSGEVGRAEGLPQQHRADAVNGPRVQALASLARSIGHALKVALVLSAPVSAPFMGSALRGRHSLPASDLYEASVLVGEWITSLGSMVWALLACVWLIVRLFSSGWHHQRPLHETLTVPALVLYLAAFAPVWPYLILPPFGSSV